MPVAPQGLEHFVLDLLAARFAGLQGGLVVARLAVGLNAPPRKAHSGSILNLARLFFFFLHHLSLSNLAEDTR